MWQHMACRLFSTYAITGGLRVWVADRLETIATAWIPAGSTQDAADACARAITMLDADRKMDLVGAEVPDDDDSVRSLDMDFVPHLTCIDAVTGHHTRLCIRRGDDGGFVLVCAN